MLKAIFYCDIKTPKGEIINKDFDFDEGTFQDKTALERYCKHDGYVIGDVNKKM